MDERATDLWQRMRPFLPLSLSLVAGSLVLWLLAYLTGLICGSLGGFLFVLALLTTGASGVVGVVEVVLRERGRLLAYICAAYGIIASIYIFATHIASGFS